MSRFRRKRYTPRADARAVPPPENLQRAQRILGGLRLPERLGRCPEDEHRMRQSSYLSEVWEAFRLSVNEKDVLEGLLRDVALARLPTTRSDLSLLDIGPDDGQLTLKICRPFSHMTMVEADAGSLARLRSNIDQRRRDVPDLPDCRLVHARFPCEGLGRRAYDLALLLHVLYFIPRDEWTKCILAAYETLRPGGMLLAAYVCDEAAMADLIARFGGARPRFGEFEDACRRALPEAQVEAYRMSNVMCALDETSLAHLFGFLMADYQAAAPAEEVLSYARSFRRADGLYVWEKTDGALLVTRPLEPRKKTRKKGPPLTSGEPSGDVP
jgi:hypothetical protein